MLMRVLTEIGTPPTLQGRGRQLAGHCRIAANLPCFRGIQGALTAIQGRTDL